MNETRQIALLVIITFAMGVVGVVAVGLIQGAGDPSGVTVDKYSAVLYSNGTLRESYVYTFTVTQYRMLYRNWLVPVSTQPIATPHIQLLRIYNPTGTIAYVKDSSGVVQLLGQTSGDITKLKSTIYNLADPNEVGCYDPYLFSPGTYEIGYLFRLYPPLESDGGVSHLNLMLASSHISYKNVTIVIADAGYVTKVFAHPPSYTVAKRGNDIVIQGSSAKDELIEVELLVDKGKATISGVESQVSGVVAKTEQANSYYSLQYGAAYWWGVAAKGLVLATPFLLLGLYMKYGREEDVVVPHYLTVLPNRDRKPWFVNLVFKNDVHRFDEDGFYATLLDLHMKK